MGFHCDHGRPIHIPSYHDFLKSGPLLVFLEDSKQLLLVPSEIARQLTQCTLRLLCVFGNEQKIEGRAAIDQELSGAIDNHSSRPGNSFDAHAIVLGKKGVPFTIDHL